jgi:branched-chain amino acid transport system substrate-binding protein
MNKQTRMSVIFSAIGLLVLLVTGCGPSPAAPPAGAGALTGDPYKIGALFDVTGSASSLGIPERDTVLMLQEELNAAGGVIGPDGLMHPVEIIIYDTESDETKTVLAAKKLISEDKVSLIIGPTQSGTTLAVLDAVQKAGIPLISCAASIKIVEPIEDRKWVFKTAPSDRLVVGALLDYLQSQGFKNLAWMSANNAYGDSGKAEFDLAVQNSEISVVASEKFEATDTDMSAQLTKIRGTNADSLIIWSIPPAASAVTKNAYELGFDIPIFHSHGIGNKTYIELATKEAAEGIIFPIGKIVVADQLPNSDPQKAILMKYIQDYQAKYNQAPTTFGGHAWDAVKLAIQILQKVGPEPEKIRDELERTQNFIGIGGVFNFSSSDHNGLDTNAITIVEIEDGKYKAVQP